MPAANAVLSGSTAFASLEEIATVSLVLITFQPESTAFTVMLNDVPAVCAVGLPVLPVAVPAAAVSPGMSNCNLANAPAFTVMFGLVLAVLVPSMMSVAVTVFVPVALFSVTLNVCVPAASAAFAGRVAVVSLEVMPTVSATVTTLFQFASTALTVTLKAVPAVSAVGVPVLPDAVPGAAVSPGVSNCNLVNAPALTTVDGLVLAVFVPSSESEAVSV